MIMRISVLSEDIHKICKSQSVSFAVVQERLAELCFLNGADIVRT